MSNKMLNAVWERSRSKGSQRLVLLAMADEANDEGLLTAYKRSQAHLAGKANVVPNTVSVAINQLVELGEVEILARGSGRAQSDYRITLCDERGVPLDQGDSDQGDSPPISRGQPPSAEGAAPSGTPPPSSPSIPVSPRPSPAGSAAPTDGGQGVLVNETHDTAGRAEKRARDARVRCVVDEVWAARDPKPTAPRVAVVKLVGPLLDAGWSAAEVIAAGKAAPVLTRNALELALNQARKPPPPARRNGTSAGAAHDQRLRDFMTGGRRRPPPNGVTDPIDVEETHGR